MSLLASTSGVVLLPLSIRSCCTPGRRGPLPLDHVFIRIFHQPRGENNEKNSLVCFTCTFISEPSADPLRSCLIPRSARCRQAIVIMCLADSSDGHHEREVATASAMFSNLIGASDVNLGASDVNFRVALSLEAKLWLWSGGFVGLNLLFHWARNCPEIFHTFSRELSWRNITDLLFAGFLPW